MKIVILGAGQVGSTVAHSLSSEENDITVVDTNAVHLKELQDRLDIRDWMAASEIVFSLCSDPPEAFGRTVPEALHLGVPVIGWDHGGVQETLAGMFPKGAVTPGDRAALLERTRAFLLRRPLFATRTEPSDGRNRSDSRSAAAASRRRRSAPSRACRLR